MNVVSVGSRYWKKLKRDRKSWSVIWREKVNLFVKQKELMWRETCERERRREREIRDFDFYIKGGMIGTFNFKVENDCSIYLAKRAFLRQNVVNGERERDERDV